MKSAFLIKYLLRFELDIFSTVVMNKYKLVLQNLCVHIANSTMFYIPYEKDDFISVIHESIKNSDHINYYQFDNASYKTILCRLVVQELNRLNKVYKAQKRKILANYLPLNFDFDFSCNIQDNKLCIEEIWRVNNFINFIKNKCLSRTIHIQIFNLLLENYSPKQIANILNIQPKKVSNIIYNLKTKNFEQLKSFYY